MSKPSKTTTSHVATLPAEFQPLQPSPTPAQLEAAAMRVADTLAHGFKLEDGSFVAAVNRAIRQQPVAGEPITETDWHRWAVKRLLEMKLVTLTLRMPDGPMWPRPAAPIPHIQSTAKLWTLRERGWVFTEIPAGSFPTHQPRPRMPRELATDVYKGFIRFETGTTPDAQPTHAPGTSKKKPPIRHNEDRDKWVAKQRARKEPTPWEEIYDEVRRQAAKRGWNVPSNWKALAEAHSRYLARLRKSTGVDRRGVE